MLAGGNYDYCLVEKVECSDKTEFHKRERFYIGSNECVNTSIPCRTQSEWYFFHKEKILEHRKQYQHENKDKIKKSEKEYYDVNKETILEHHKQYQHENKDKISKQRREYRDENKEKIYAKAAVKVTCECGCSVRKSDISTHRKTQKHIDLMSQLQQSL